MREHEVRTRRECSSSGRSSFSRKARAWNKWPRLRHHTNLSKRGLPSKGYPCAYRKLYPSGFFTLDGLEDAPAAKRDSVFHADRAAYAAEIELSLSEARTDGAIDLSSPRSRSSRAARAYR